MGFLPLKKLNSEVWSHHLWLKSLVGIIGGFGCGGGAEPSSWKRNSVKFIECLFQECFELSRLPQSALNYVVCEDAHEVEKWLREECPAICIFPRFLTIYGENRQRKGPLCCRLILDR